MNSRPERQSYQRGKSHGPDCAFVRDHLGSFALDALDSVDRGIVEHHLRWCESCRDEADGFDRVVGFLHLASPLGPGPGANAKRELMQRVTANDETVSSTNAGPNRPDRQAASRGTTPAWIRFASTALIASLALALIVVGVWANSLRNDLSEQDEEMRDQTQLTEALANGGQVQLYSVEQSCPTCHGNGQLGVSESNDMGMVVGYNFDPSQQHDVWGMNDTGDMTMFCELYVDSTGAVMQMFSFPDAPSAFTDVYITDEEGTMIYVAHLSSATDESTPDDDVTPLLAT